MILIISNKVENKLVVINSMRDKNKIMKACGRSSKNYLNSLCVLTVEESHQRPNHVEAGQVAN